MGVVGVHGRVITMAGESGVGQKAPASGDVTDSADDPHDASSLDCFPNTACKHFSISSDHPSSGFATRAEMASQKSLKGSVAILPTSGRPENGDPMIDANP